MKKKYTEKIISILVVLSIWQLLAMLVGENLIFPSPIASFNALIDIFFEPTTYQIISHSIARVMLAFVIAFTLGILIGFIMYFYPMTALVFSPFIRIIQTTPVMSFIMLALLWMNSNLVPIFIGFLMGLPIVATATLKGLNAIDKKFIMMTEFFDVSKLKRIQQLYIPAIFPFIELALKNALSLTWKVCIAAEVLSYPHYAMGAELLNAKTLLESDGLFAWTFILIICAIISEYILKYLLRLYKYR